VRSKAPRRVVFFDWLGEWSMPNEGLIKILGEHGFGFVSPGSGHSPEFVISQHHTSKNWRQINDWRIPIDNRVLVVTEARVVDPLPFSRFLRRNYGNTFYSSHYSKTSDKLFGWPWSDGNVNSSEERIPRVVMIQANKFSAIRGEQYSLRRRVLSELLDRGIPLDLYGSGWDAKFSKNFLTALRSDYYRIRQSIAARQFFPASRWQYRCLNTRRFKSCGEVDNKAAILSRYRFSLVIENDRDFFTEKLMDSLASGCISFYLGPEDLVNQELPGLILLPSTVPDLVDKVCQILTQSDDSLPPGVEIRDAALRTFKQPPSKTWERFGQLWLEYILTRLP